MNTYNPAGTPVSAGKCRGHYPDLIAEFSTGLRIWGGAAAGIDDDLINEIPVTLVIDLTDSRSRKYLCEPCISADDKAMELLGMDVTCPTMWDSPAVMYIDWPDYGKGPSSLTKEWWENLGAKIATLTGDIAVCCVGGHGRTGTFMSILLCHLPKYMREEIGLKNKCCPVLTLRDLYCDDAVESERQLDYIEDMTGRKVVAKIHRHYHAPVVKNAMPSGNPTYIKKVADATEPVANQKGWDYVPGTEDDTWEF